MHRVTGLAYREVGSIGLFEFWSGSATETEVMRFITSTVTFLNTRLPVAHAPA